MTVEEILAQDPLLAKVYRRLSHAEWDLPLGIVWLGATGILVGRCDVDLRRKIKFTIIEYEPGAMTPPVDLVIVDRAGRVFRFTEALLLH